MWVLLMTIATIGSMIGYALQSKVIRKLQSGKSLSIPWIASLMIGALTKVIYGIAELDMLLAVNCILNIVGQAVVFFPLVKYKKLRMWEKTMFAGYAVLLVLMVVTPFKGLLLLAIAALNFVAGLAQPAEVWLNKSTGVVQIAMLGWSAFGGSLYCLYCLHFGYYAPAFTFGVYAAGQLAMMAQWYFVRRSAGSSS